MALALYAWPVWHGLTGPKVTVSVSTASPEAEALLTRDFDMARASEVLSRKPHLAFLLSVWTALVLTLGVTGLVLAARAIRRRRLVTLFRYRPKLRRFWSLREAARIALLVGLGAALLPFAYVSLTAWGVPGLTDAHLRSLITTLLVEGLLVLIVWAFASTKALKPSTLLGLSARTRRGAIAAGLIGYVAIFPWVFGLLWVIIRTCQQLGIQPPLEPIHELLLLDERRVVLWTTVALACVVGPLVEELFFRGVVFVAVRKHTSRLVAMLISGGLFSAMHTNFLGFLPILILGCLLADLYERTGSLLAPIAVHMLHNTLLVGVGLTMKAVLFG